MNKCGKTFIGQEELEANWHALNLLFGLLNPSADIGDFTLKTAQTNLVNGLALAARAHTVALQFYGQEDGQSVSLGNETGPIGSCAMEEVVNDHQICVPIMAGTTAVGRIEVCEPTDRKGFRPQERMLVKSVSAYLGMIANRALLLHTQEDFTERMSEDLRIQTMYDAICEATEQADGNLQKAAEATVRLVGRGITCRCVVVMFWEGEKQSICCENGDQDAVIRLKQVVTEQRKTVLQKGCYVRSFLRESEGREGRKEFEPLSAIVAFPLKRFFSGEGIIALARDGEGAEFTTIEKRAVKVLSAFLSEWNTKR